MQICRICKKEFYVRQSRLKKGEGIYCSVGCSGKDNWRRQSGNKNVWWRGGKVKTRCGVCNKEYLVFPSEVKKIKTCSKKCRSKALSIRHMGKNNPSWRGGKSSIYLLIRATSKYSSWRQSVFIKDNFTCQKCKTFGGKLEAHHKKRFSELLKEIEKNLPLFTLYEGSLIYAPLWDINNGITLCEKCHGEIHAKNKKKL